MTTITLIGNAGADGELRFTKSGIPVLTFNLATSARVKDGDEWKDGPTSWRRVTVWRGLAEALASEVTKGRRLIVVGTEEVRQYETEGGGKGLSVEVTADHVGVYVFPARQGGQQGTSAPHTPSQPSTDSWGGGESYGDSTPF